ncbi:hypothetical protein Tco_1368847 [Tanacetum coccineum]
MKIILDEEEVAIDAIHLAVKSPSIVGWKIYKEGRKSYYQIIRADGKSQMYMFISQMLKSFDREDLEDLYKLVKAKYESTKPVEDLDLLLWGDLKTMFEPHVEDAVWRNQQAYKVLDWKLYESCRGRIVRIKSLLYAVRITAAHVCVNTAQLELVLLRDFKENMLNCSVEVNAASGNMLEVTTASEYQVIAASVTVWLRLESIPLTSRFIGIGYSLKDKNQDKTKNGNEKSVKSQSQPKSQQVKAKDETEEILMDQPAAKLMGRREIYHAAGGKLHDKNAEESWALIEDLALYDNEGGNDEDEGNEHNNNVNEDSTRRGKYADKLLKIPRTLEHPSKIEERIKRDPDPTIPTNHVNRRILEWEEQKSNH